MDYAGYFSSILNMFLVIFGEGSVLLLEREETGSVWMTEAHYRVPKSRPL